MMKKRRMRMQLKIHSCGICDCAPEWQWQTAKQGFSDYDLWAVFRGAGAILPSLDGAQEIPVREGVCLLLEPNVSYFAHHDPARPLLVINVHFDILDENGEKTHPYRLCAREISDTELFSKLLRRMVSYDNANDADGACAYLRCALEEFFASEPLQEAGRAGAWARITREICAEIDGGAMMTLSAFAARYGYTERHLGKMFAQTVGVSFSDYLQNSRIGRAKMLLRQTEMPVHEIAETLGFYDACHFTRAFRKYTGLSPLAYRKQG